MEIVVHLPGERDATLHSCLGCGSAWWDVDGVVVTPAVVHRLVPKSASPAATWRRTVRRPTGRAARFNADPTPSED